MSLFTLGVCPKDERNCFEKCPSNYEPVCSEDNMTYLNKCIAKCENIKIKYES